MGIGQTKLRGLIGDGEIRVIRILGKILLLESDLEDYLRGHYGPLRKVEKKGNGMSPLPEFVKNSALLKKSA